MEKPAVTLRTLQRALLDEVNITMRLLHSNASSTSVIIFGVIFPRMMSRAPVSNPLVLLLKAIVAATTFTYVFDICNQTVSVEEDCRNRPSRPIPAGFLSIEGACRRWSFTWLLAPPFLFAIAGFDASVHLVCWEVWILFCYIWPKPGHWLFKNLFSAVGNFFLLRISNDLVVMHSPRAEMSVELDVFCCLWIFLTIHVQDFHDIEGDRETGRKTLPVILRPAALWWTRQVTAFVLVSIAIGLAIAEYQEFGHKRTSFTSLFAMLQFVAAVATALRVSQTETTDQAEDTYKGPYMMTAALLKIYLSMIDS